MKCILYLMAMLSIAGSRPDAPLWVLDKDLKKPLQKATAFTSDQYLQRYFPVYADDVPSIIASADIAVKRMDEPITCHSIDTITTAHTTILLQTDCEELPSISVTIITRLEETETSFGFALVSKEKNWRKAQQRILDFATYLDQ